MLAVTHLRTREELRRKLYFLTRRAWTQVLIHLLEYPPGVVRLQAHDLLIHGCELS